MSKKNQNNNTTTYGNPGHGLHRIGTKIRTGWERNPYLLDNLHVNDKIDEYKKTMKKPNTKAFPLIKATQYHKNEWQHKHGYIAVPVNART